MPVKKCPNGKWRIGGGPCMYTTKENANKAYEAYRVIKHSGLLKKIESIKPRVAAVLSKFFNEGRCE